MLRAAERHLNDRRLHIVAAPGAGKTTLGLEIFRRLGRPALALAPTLTIRKQWIVRLHDFLGDRHDDTPEWLAEWTSTDLRAPAFFTVATYQGVHALHRADDERATDHDESDPGDAPSDEEVGALVAIIREAGIGTLILDEAHHLKRAWWSALDRVVSSFDDLVLVSLTGTPPYDATGAEWRRYEALCGPIDDEISTPELVKAGTLCPHQDFVYAVTPKEPDRDAARAHDRAVAETIRELLDDPSLQAAIDGHPWVAGGNPSAEEVLAEPELAVALLVYLRATAAGLPPGLLSVLDLGSVHLPVLDRRWWEVLLRAFLFGDTFGASDTVGGQEAAEVRRGVARRLRARGLLWRRSLRLVRSAPMERSLALSAVKVAACAEIHRLERSVRGAALRQVVLCDYVRAEALDVPPGATDADLGAVPIFDALASHDDVALLTGTVAALHERHRHPAEAALGARGGATFEPLPHRPGWLRVRGVGSGRLVAAVTRLLEAGDLRTVVGTRSLLGEGWDAPVVNSLVLASFVGATVGTNQMRGRAIRRDASAPDKVASVWHIVAVAPETPTGFLDLDALRERFRTFVGLSADGSVIESGLERLGLPAIRSHADIEALNRVGATRLQALGEVAAGWRAAVEGEGPQQVVPVASTRSPPTLRPLHLADVGRLALIEAGLGLAILGADLLRGAVAGAYAGGLTALMVALGVPMLWVAPKLVRAARLTARHWSLDGTVRQIGHALLDALREIERIDEPDDVAVQVTRDGDGSVAIGLRGGSFYDQSLFADAIGEVLGPIDNPRYLLRRSASASDASATYHAVPTALGGKKEHAERFHRAWLRRVGPAELVYTRRTGGRAELLKARARAFAADFSDPVRRLDRWQ